MIGIHALVRNWWALAIRGIAAILFGILAIIFPGATWLALLFLFGAYAFVDGIFALVLALRAVEAHERWWPLALEGLAGLVIGIITFFEPRATAFALYVTIAAWAILTGILEIVAAVRLRRHLEDELLLMIGGIASILFGILMVIVPPVGLLVVVWLVGIYAILFGILLLWLALRLRRLAQLS